MRERREARREGGREGKRKRERAHARTLCETRGGGETLDRRALRPNPYTPYLSDLDVST